MNVRLTQIDGALPNLALMKLSHWHRAKGDHVHLTRHIQPTLFEPEYDVVYGSSIFDFSEERRRAFRQQWPQARSSAAAARSTSCASKRDHRALRSL